MFRLAATIWPAREAVNRDAGGACVRKASACGFGHRGRQIAVARSSVADVLICRMRAAAWRNARRKAVRRGGTEAKSA